MFEVFRPFFSETGISGGLLVAVDTSGNVYPCPVTGYAIGTTEAAGGNISEYDTGTNAALPITVRLFGPTRNVSMTGVAVTGFLAGALIYLASAGYGAATGTVLLGVALAGYPNGMGNGGLIEVAETNG
jgi:hypothetical protein